MKSLRIGKIVPPMAGQTNTDYITQTGVLMSIKMTTIKKMKSKQFKGENIITEKENQIQ